MKTKVKVNYFKDSGKWYTKHKFLTNTPVHNSEIIEAEIAQRFSYPDMNYVYSARNKDKTEFNSRLVIKSK